MNTQVQATQTQNGGNRGGRKRGSKAIIPPGHVDAAGLAAALGVSPKSIGRMLMRGDPIIPPRSPIAGSGKRRRQIWRIRDIEALTGVQIGEEGATTGPLLAAQPAPAPVFSAIGASTPDVPTSKPSTGRRKPGRPRGTGKFSK